MDLARTLKWMDAALGGPAVPGSVPGPSQLARLQDLLNNEGHGFSSDQLRHRLTPLVAEKAPDPLATWVPTIAGAPGEPLEARDWGWVFAKIRQDRLRRGIQTTPLSAATKTALRWALVNQGPPFNAHVPVPAWFEQNLSLASPRDWPALLDCLAPLLRTGDPGLVDWPLARLVIEVGGHPDHAWPWHQVRWALPETWHVPTWSHAWGPMSLREICAATHCAVGLDFLGPRLYWRPTRPRESLWHWMLRPHERHRRQRLWHALDHPMARPHWDQTWAWLHAHQSHDPFFDTWARRHRHPWLMAPASSP